MNDERKLSNAERGGAQTLPVKRKPEVKSDNMPITRRNQLLRKIRHSISAGQPNKYQNINRMNSTMPPKETSAHNESETLLQP